MSRLSLPVALACATAVALLLQAGAAQPRGQSSLTAAPQLYVGFLDDVAFRWSRARTANLDRAQAMGATVVRTIVDWSWVAPRRPRRPADPFAPAYRLNDLDELVRNAEKRGIEVLLTIWGTPAWANGGAGRNVAPSDPRDLERFAQALASRYSGRHPGYPFVRFFSVWNEPNSARFLAPQFDESGTPVAPRVYASLVAAAYRGIKRGSPNALVAAGETAARGHDRPAVEGADSESPARFAELVAQADPHLPFDAWAHHPYPADDRAAPGAPQRWPAVGLSSLGRFGGELARWFEREEVPLWVTEFAYRTSPEIRGAAPYALQARYLAQTVRLVRSQPSVRMLVWFIFRDVANEPWQSGLIDRRGRPKPALARFAASAAPTRRALVVTADPGQVSHLIDVPALELRAHLPAGALVGVRYVLLRCDRVVDSGAKEGRIGADGRVALETQFVLRPSGSYRLVLAISDQHGFEVRRDVLVQTGVAGPPRCNLYGGAAAGPGAGAPGPAGGWRAHGWNGARGERGTPGPRPAPAAR